MPHRQSQHAAKRSHHMRAHGMQRVYGPTGPGRSAHSRALNATSPRRVPSAPYFARDRARARAVLRAAAELSGSNMQGSASCNNLSKISQNQLEGQLAAVGSGGVGGEWACKTLCACMLCRAFFHLCPPRLSINSLNYNCLPTLLLLPSSYSLSLPTTLLPSSCRAQASPPG